MDNLIEPCAPRTRKPRGQGASRRGEILDAAKRLFIEEGFAQATMRRIASEVGVSPTALYLHFADKDAILKAIAEDFFSELLVLLRHSQRSDLPPLVRLRAGLRAYIEFGLERADEYRLTFNNARERGLARPCEDVDVADLSFEVLVTSVHDLMEAGMFRRNDPVLVAESLWICMHGVTSAAIDLGDRLQRGISALIDCSIDTMITGLSCRDAAVSD
jgi:AcrR family transcriptional regulator